MSKHLIVAISGASGAIYGIRTLQLLQGDSQVRSHLVISHSAQLTITQETDWTPEHKF